MDRFFLIAAYSDTEQGGIYTYRFAADGRPRQIAFAPLKGAGYLAKSRDGKHLAATCTLDGSTDALAFFQINENGNLNLLDLQPTGGLSSCHVGFSPDENFVYTANYRSGSLTEFRLANDRLTRTQIIIHEGRGTHPKRQDAPHVHYVHPTPDGRYIASVDLGLDAIDCYFFEPGRGISPLGAKRSPIAPAASGPRHLEFLPESNRAFLVNELANTVMTLDYADGEFQIRDCMPTLPFTLDCYTSKAGAIRLSPDKKMLCVSNRGVDSLVFYQVSSQGNLTQTQFCYCGGKSPRDIHFLDGGRRFACADEFSEKVTFFRWTERGYEPDGNELTLPRPLCILPC
ncbi:MAG: lactonase family protein [Victivallaceae bacterium]|nr:lactonase family protein [Victivallaceae bacterium]